MQRITTPRGLLALIIVAAATGSASQQCYAQQREDIDCIGTDTLGLLPLWDYCEIVDSLQAYFSSPFPGLPNNRQDRYNRFDTLTLRAVRVLAWGSYSHDRTKSRFRKHFEKSGRLMTYDDRILLYLDIVSGWKAEPGVALVVMDRDTSQGTYYKHSWRITVRKPTDEDPPGWFMMPYSSQFFDLKNDSTLMRTFANRYLDYVYAPETSSNGIGIETTLQDGYVRHRTWDAVLGRDPLPQQPGME